MSVCLKWLVIFLTLERISEGGPYIVVAVVGCIHLTFTLYLCSQFGYVMNGEFIVVCYVSYFLPFCYSPFS